MCRQTYPRVDSARVVSAKLWKLVPIKSESGYGISFNSKTLINKHSQPNSRIIMEDYNDSSRTRVKDDDIHVVDSTESAEFNEFKWAISHSLIIGLDAEWKPVVHNHSHQPNTLPTVLILQIACMANSSNKKQHKVFLLDLSAIHLPDIYDYLKHVFVSPHVLKLGFRFKQDLRYLSKTFSHHGCHSGFDTVVPYLDIANIYLRLHQPQLNGTSRKPNCNMSLSSICHDLLGISLSKELQCSDWSVRPLTHQQKTYAALDVLCLIHIFNLFLHTLNQGSFQNLAKLDNSSFNLGLKQILTENDITTRILRSMYPEAVEMVVIEYGDKIDLTEPVKKPRSLKRRQKLNSRKKRVYTDALDSLLGGDECPKFLCDVTLEGLEKQLRCVGVDAAVPYSKKLKLKELIDQAIKEKRVLLTRERKPFIEESKLKNQIYRVKSVQKFDQLSEVIETFQLNICEDQLMSRCTKCNARFSQKLLSMEEAIEAAKGLEGISDTVFKDFDLYFRSTKFWQCTDCHHIYWEGTYYHSSMKRYIDICKISSTYMSKPLTQPRTKVGNQDVEKSENTSTHISTASKKSTRESFVSMFPPRNIKELLDVAQGIPSIIVGTIIAIHEEEGWWYIGCKRCKKKVIRAYDMVDPEAEAEADMPKKPCGGKDDWWCTKCNIVPNIKTMFRLQIRVQDESGTVSLTLWDNEVQDVVHRTTASQLCDKYGKMEHKDMFPIEITALVGRKYAFQVSIDEYNKKKMLPVFTVLRLSGDPKIIKSVHQTTTPTKETEATSSASQTVTPCHGRVKIC